MSKIFLTFCLISANAFAAPLPLSGGPVAGTPIGQSGLGSPMPGLGGGAPMGGPNRMNHGGPAPQAAVQTRVVVKKVCSFGMCRRVAVRVRVCNGPGCNRSVAISVKAGPAVPVPAPVPVPPQPPMNGPGNVGCGQPSRRVFTVTRMCGGGRRGCRPRRGC